MTIASVNNTASLTLPQWSPPFRGGMTSTNSSALDYIAGPQWSPPFRGGMTWCRRRW